MLLAEGIRNSSTIDKREMNIFFNERRFWRNVLERLIDIALFLSERNLAFRGSEEVLGSPHNGNFLGIFELLARRDPILKELQDRIKNKNTKDHYLSPTIQNELIELLATEVEKDSFIWIVSECVHRTSNLTNLPRDCYQRWKKLQQIETDQNF